MKTNCRFCSSGALILVFFTLALMLWMIYSGSPSDGEKLIVMVTSSPTSCQCNRFFHHQNVTRTSSSYCSPEADRRRGPNQDVVTYSLFGHPDRDPEVRKRYFGSLEARAARVALAYPGWIMRIYHNLSDTDLYESTLCPMACRHDHVDLCDVTKIRLNAASDLTSSSPEWVNPRMWRFLVMLDPLVSRFISRDIDSEILIPRETSAVSQWLRSNFTFHVMRDHPSHGGFMLAGLWGAKSFQRPDLIRRLGRVLLWSARGDQSYQTDQNRLDYIVWPFATFDVMAHDSYFCNNWAIQLGQIAPTFPFPTERVGRNYTGYDLVRADIADAIRPCPVECRPPKHKDWIFC